MYSEKKPESVFSKRVKAGSKRTYFFDVRTNRKGDYFLAITESRKILGTEGYEKNKVFLYREDFNKFLKGLEETIHYVKTELMPDYDFTAFDREDDGRVDGFNEENSRGDLSTSSDLQFKSKGGFEDDDRL